VARPYPRLVGANKISNEWQKINTIAQYAEETEARVDTILSEPDPNKDPELVDIRTPDPSYTPQRAINVAGDITRDMQEQFMSHKAETVTKDFSPPADSLTSSIKFTRDANYNGGQHGWVNSMIYSVTTAGPNTESFEWGITSVMNNHGNGENVGIYGQGNSYKPSCTTWGGVMEARDMVGDPITGRLVGLEVDLFSNGNNGDNKIILDLVLGKHTQDSPNTPLAYAGIRLAPQAGVDTNGKFSYGILMEGEMATAISLQGKGTFGYRDQGTYAVGIDLSQGTHSAAAMRIKAGEKLSFDQYDDVYMLFNPVNGYIEFYYQNTRKGYIDVGATGTDHEL